MSFLPRRHSAWIAVAAFGALAACSDENDPVQPVAPNPPANVQATSLTSTSTRLTFTAASGASAYVIERATGATGGTFTVLDTITAPPFDDTGLAAQMTYRYRVASLSGNLKGAYSPEASVTTGATPVVTVSGNIGANRTFDRDTIYKLSGFVKVTNGVTLTIESGTRIIGDQATAGSALFILRGAKIIADGTADAPIVFTSEKAAGQRARGDWGGLIVVGGGTINRSGQVILEVSNANVPNGGAPGVD